MAFNVLVLVCLTYVIVLFAVAWGAERRAAAGRGGWLRSPLVYTLSLSIYCTAWTFYGAVGYAARSGLEFVTIYLGPTIAIVGWWWLLRKLVRVVRTQRITSVADLISSRYGKSAGLGALVTILAVVGTTPYIALQLQSVTLSFAVFATEQPTGWALPDLNATALWVAGGLALFTILFGTRNLDANERHDGVVAAIAVEAVVKLVALLAVGVFVVWGLAGGPSDIARIIDTSPIAEWQVDGGRWAALTFLAGAAFLCLPRMFQVLAVENAEERHLATASWAFPLYLFLMSLFVVPIAVVGLTSLPESANPDLFVLTLPLTFDRDGLAMLAFLGGFSSATSMVIVAAIALSTMVSNHIVMPIWLWARGGETRVTSDVRHIVLMSRRISIAAILALGYVYFRLSGGGAALAAIGLISFTGVVQVLPAMVGGLFWRGATRVGAAAGLSIGFAVWLYALFLPSLGADVVLGAALLDEGPWGIGWLRPQALFGIEGLDPVVHAILWSLTLNAGAFVLGSLVSFASPIERVQGAGFVNVFDRGAGAPSWLHGDAEPEDLLVMAQRILGDEAGQRLFHAAAAAQGKDGYLPDVTPEFIDRLERELTGSVGAATAHAMLGRMVGDGSAVSVEDLMAVADESAQMMEYSSQLEAKSVELGRTARQLREANEKLTQLSIQKDGFLSQISHELRTPMTSIRAFSEILLADGEMTDEERCRHAGIIHDEAIRLSRLLDDLLDLSVLENGQVSLNWRETQLREAIERAVQATSATAGAPIRIRRDRVAEDIVIVTDGDRLVQVFINLIANARKYCDARRPELSIAVRQRGGRVEIDFVDNGSGIPRDAQAMIFEKFARLGDQSRAGGAGLGLAICREIVGKLGGHITYLPGQGGAAFRITLPVARAVAA